MGMRQYRIEGAPVPDAVTNKDRRDVAHLVRTQIQAPHAWGSDRIVVEMHGREHGR